MAVDPNVPIDPANAQMSAPEITDTGVDPDKLQQQGQMGEQVQGPVVAPNQNEPVITQASPGQPQAHPDQPPTVSSLHQHLFKNIFEVIVGDTKQDTQIDES